MGHSRRENQRGATLTGRHEAATVGGLSSKIKFGTDGWRGVIAEDFTDDNVRIVVHAIARYVARAEKPGGGILVGYDTRFGSERFARVAAETVAAAGTPVWLSADACPTPALSLLVRGRASAAIVAQVERELEKVLHDGVPLLPPRKDLIHSLDIWAPYLETLDRLVDWSRLRSSKFRFLIDPMHGAGRGVLKNLFRRHGIEVDEIRGNRDPLFGGVNPEPIEPHVEELRRGVRAGDYDAGFAFDGDADRIGAIDHDGTFITPHQIFSILLWHLVGTRKISGGVVKTFSTTKMI